MTAHPVGCGCAECQNPNLVKLVFRGKPTQSRAELYEGYSRQFRRAADSVFADNEQPELADRLRANVSRFAAYKSAYVEGEFARIANDPKYNDVTRKAAMNAAEDRFARWTDAEYNTATARCRTAKQMAEFMEPDNVRLFPNLEWLATRSANPRAEHQAFVGLILPKSDPFWNTHTPGTEWNCKCDLAETDAPASNADNLPDIKPPRGLEGNPYHTGEVFTDEVGYIRNAAPDVLPFVNECYYPDNKSSLRINVNADRNELTDNIRTGRILVETEKVSIRPHFEQEPGNPIKNPEYLINGEIADAKRVESPKGIAAGFKKAKKQGCRSVVIDFSKAKYYNHNDAARALLNREIDFQTKEINDCFIVYNGRKIKFSKTDFTAVELLTRELQVAFFENKLKKAFD